jgi:hypothetical protein
VLAAEGDYAAIHARTAAISDRLGNLQVQKEGNLDFRINSLRTSRSLLAESALRLGRFEEGAVVTQGLLAKPLFDRRADPRQKAEFTARTQVRLAQALLGADRRNEALSTLQAAEAYYRQQLAEGASDTYFRQDFARLLYCLARAQGRDDAGRTRGLALLNEALGQLGSLSIEAQQLVASKELLQWVTDARRELQG